MTSANKLRLSEVCAGASCGNEASIMLNFLERLWFSEPQRAVCTFPFFSGQKAALTASFRLFRGVLGKRRRPSAFLDFSCRYLRFCDAL